MDFSRVDFLNAYKKCIHVSDGSGGMRVTLPRTALALQNENIAFIGGYINIREYRLALLFITGKVSQLKEWRAGHK